MNIPIIASSFAGIARAQAKRCTQREIAYLCHWRDLGYKIGIDEKIPLSVTTPPSFSTRHPVLDAVAGAVIAIAAVMMGCMWLASGAGLMR